MQDIDQPKNGLSGAADYRPLTGNAEHTDSPGSENVEDRENVGQVKPEDYPLADRRASDGTGSGEPTKPPLDEQMESERLNPGQMQP